MFLKEILCLALLTRGVLSQFEECDSEEEVVPGTPAIFESPGFSYTNISIKFVPGTNCRMHYTTAKGYTLNVNGSIFFDRTAYVFNCAGQKNKFIVSREGLRELVNADQYCTSSTITVQSLFNKLTLAYTSEVDDKKAGRFRVSINAVPVPKALCECGWGIHSFRLIPSRLTYFGYASTVGFYDEAEDAIICTGVIIHYDYIIAAAHCFPDIEKAKTLEILVGYRLYPENEDVYQAKYFIETIEIHEEYATSPNNFDIAIVKTTMSIDFTLGVSPICMPTGKFFQSEDFYSRLRDFDLVAWTKYNGDGADQLLVNEVKKNMQISTCSRYYSELYGSKKHICTIANPLSNVTAEYNGAVLIFTSGNRRYLIGTFVPSFTRANGSPTVYLRIVNLLSWISSKTGNVEFCSKMF